MVNTVSYEPVVGEEILFQPKGMSVEYVKDLKSANDILKHETPLYTDVIELVMDFTVGTTTYWKKQFTNGFINQLNCITNNGESPYRLYEMFNNHVRGYYKRSINFYTWKFEKIMKEKNIKTKKQIIEYYKEKRLALKFNNEFDRYAFSTEKELWRMKKDSLIKQYALMMYDIADNPIQFATAFNKYLEEDCNETKRKNIMKDFMKRNLYEYYMFVI